MDENVFCDVVGPPKSIATDRQSNADPRSRMTSPLKVVPPIGSSIFAMGL